MIPEPDAVANPGAMMIHFQNASTAFLAMMCPLWFVLVAPLTPSKRTTMSCIEDFRVRLDAIWNPSWVNTHTLHQTDQLKEQDAMEDEEFDDNELVRFGSMQEEQEYVAHA